MRGFVFGLLLFGFYVAGVMALYTFVEKLPSTLEPFASLFLMCTVFGAIWWIIDYSRKDAAEKARERWIRDAAYPLRGSRASEDEDLLEASRIHLRERMQNLKRAVR